MKAYIAADKVGYESSSQFNREFKRYFGQSPVEVMRELRAAWSDVTGDIFKQQQCLKKQPFLYDDKPLSAKNQFPDITGILNNFGQ